MRDLNRPENPTYRGLQATGINNTDKGLRFSNVEETDKKRHLGKDLLNDCALSLGCPIVEP